MDSYRTSCVENGRRVVPIIVNNLNIARGTPCLLSFDDAKTLFHEFGHGLHGLLSQVTYRSQAGTSVRADFVEFPSQMMEHWMDQREILETYARHYETKEPIPVELLDLFLSSLKFTSGFDTVEYLACAIFDLQLHMEKEAVSDIDKYERELLESIRMPPSILLRHRPCHFSHLFSGSGYASKYYVYIYANVLDEDGFQAFVDQGDIFHPGLAAKLLHVYQAGDSEDASHLFRSFRGREPVMEALFRSRGFIP